MDSQPYSISIIIPVYNEVALLESAINQIKNFLAQHFSDFEIIIVESGSTDESKEKCDALVQHYSLVRVIHQAKREGFGSALKLGYRHATKDLLWLVTVDMPFPLESILSALPKFVHYDAVFSYRSQDPRNWKRKFQSYIYNVILKVFLGLKVKHANSAFKVYKREVIENLPIISNGWFIDAEIIYRLQKNNVPFTVIPVPLIDRTGGVSTVKASTFIGVLKEFFYFMKHKNTL